VLLKGLAEYLDLSLGDLLEGIELHAFDGRRGLGPGSLAVVGELRRVYGLELDSSDAHQLSEIENG
jgi:hypothetical protein